MSSKNIMLSEISWAQRDKNPVVILMGKPNRIDSQTKNEQDCGYQDRQTERKR